MDDSTEDKQLANIHLRHSMLASVHSNLKNYLLCMDRDYFGPRIKEEIELTKNLHVALEQIENLMDKYYNQEEAVSE